jgi:hypothetical protein
MCGAEAARLQSLQSLARAAEDDNMSSVTAMPIDTQATQPMDSQDESAPVLRKLAKI